MKGSWVPLAGMAVVLTLGATLVTVSTLRPWASVNTSFETHFNILDEVPEGYSRTAVTWVQPPEGAPRGWAPSGHDAEAGTGRVLYVARACASCHGLSGQGAAVGPTLLDVSERRFNRAVRQGSGGMPAYPETELPETDLTAIIGYLTALGPAPALTPVAAKPTATPYPTPTPTPAPAPTPAPTATPAPIASPGALPTATPQATQPPSAQKLYLDVGCGLCHGSRSEGTIVGPPLAGFTTEQIVAAVRQGVKRPGSKYPSGMDPYTVKDLSDEELRQIIEFLLGLK